MASNIRTIYIFLTRQLYERCFQAAELGLLETYWQEVEEVRIRGVFCFVSHNNYRWN